MSRRSLGALWLVCFFVCPLLFFTDLTRNPYASQIVLLNVAVAAALAVYALQGASSGSWAVPRTPLDAPLAAWVSVCVLSALWSYSHHVAFFRPAIRVQSFSALAFLIFGTVLPFYFGSFCARLDPPERAPGPRASWLVFFLFWGALWTAHSAAVPPAAPLTLSGHLFDGYGGLLWAAGFAAVFWLSDRGTLQDYWKVALGVAFLSGAYGICQYLGLEFLWPRNLNPYGGRSVSTFGNPNFISSYMVIFLPIAVLYYLKARRGMERLAFATVCLVMEGCLLSSLTRSSWIGALVALGALFLWKPVRSLLTERPRAHALFLGAALALLAFWPHTSVQGATPTVLERVTELHEVFEAHPAEVYSPFYQRLLLWACAWQMGNENPLLGKGWGLFDLFYPFYQGSLLAHFDVFRTMRTHGNAAHNELLEVWSQTGLAGVGILIWTWTTFFLCVKRWLKSRSADEWTLAAAAGVAGMLADNLLNVSLRFPIPAFAFWWQAGAAMGLSEPKAGAWRAWRPRWRPAGWSAALLLAAACALFGGWWFRQWERDMHYFLGFKLVHNGLLSSGVEELETAYRWNRQEVNADYELGNAYARSQRYEQAMWAYAQAFRAHAGYDEIYYNAGTLLLQQLGRPQEGLRYLRVAHWINPLTLETYQKLSAVYLGDLSRYDEDARELLVQGVHFFPENAPLLANLGYLYERDREDARAEEFDARALRLDPDRAVAEQNFKTVLLKEGKKKDPLLEDLALYRDLNARMERKDSSEKTWEEVRRAAEAFPRAEKTRFFAGIAEAVHGRPDRALEWLEPLSREHPEDVGVWQNLGELYYHLGRQDDAVRAFQMALGFDPSNAVARNRLSRLAR